MIIGGEPTNQCKHRKSTPPKKYGGERAHFKTQYLVARVMIWRFENSVDSENASIGVCLECICVSGQGSDANNAANSQTLSKSGGL